LNCQLCANVEKQVTISPKGLGYRSHSRNNTDLDYPYDLMLFSRGVTAFETFLGFVGQMRRQKIWAFGSRLSGLKELSPPPQ
jgi:hypothetical protein